MTPSSNVCRWPLFVLVLGSCSRPDAGKAPSELASQAKATQTQIAAARAALSQRSALEPRAASHLEGPAGAASPDRAGHPVANAGVSTAGDKLRLLGEPLPGGELPAAPGAPHLYHLGAEAFFLDQEAAVGLSTEQRAKLAEIKQRADLAHETTQRSIDEAEHELWALTSAEKPDARKIDAEITELSRLGSQQRMDYVRAIGSAVAVLNEAQRRAIIAAATMPSPAPAGMSATDAGGPGMGMPMDEQMGPMGGTPDAGSPPPMERM